MIERRSLPGGVTALIEPDLERDGFLIAFTERTGGVSEGPFASLNLSLARGDAGERVAANRRRVSAALGIDRFAVADQVHGSNVARVDASLAGAGFEDRSTALRATDAMVTSVAGLALAILVADCVPVALASVGEGKVAVVHVGWRGLAAGVLPATLRRFDDIESVRAVIGPAVGPDHYEVGEEVVRAVGEGSPGCALVDRTGTRPRLDQGATVERILRRSAVERVERLDVCTACEPSRFFSHRRDPAAGRQALIAVQRERP
jgi:purine-nucleoside/S-methyl-5'-thioadenosine phosphorylase / adenosine deaminase